MTFLTSSNGLSKSRINHATTTIYTYYDITPRATIPGRPISPTPRQQGKPTARMPCTIDGERRTVGETGMPETTQNRCTAIRGRARRTLAIPARHGAPGVVFRCGCDRNLGFPIIRAAKDLRGELVSDR